MANKILKAAWLALLALALAYVSAGAAEHKTQRDQSCVKGPITGQRAWQMGMKPCVEGQDTLPDGSAQDKRTGLQEDAGADSGPQGSAPVDKESASDDRPLNNRGGNDRPPGDRGSKDKAPEDRRTGNDKAPDYRDLDDKAPGDGWQDEKKDPAGVTDSLIDSDEAADEASNKPLKLFGHGVFTGPERAPENLPVASDYPVGYGDELIVAFWGRVSGEWPLKVSREGSITVPMLGRIFVNGLTFSEAKELISRKARTIVGADVSVTMGRLRGIQVFVLGEVVRPGSHRVSAVSTVTNALMAAGGTTGIGSLRRVELRREGAPPRPIDLYDILLKGDKSGDLRLRNGDVVFVPVTGPVTGVSGSVRRPALYEISGKTTLQQAIDLAGGLSPSAYAQQVQVERTEGNTRRVVIDIDANDSARANGFHLNDGDLVRIFEVPVMDTNAVYLYGNVKRPGRYELKPGMRLKDLLSGFTDLIEDAHLEYGMIKRTTKDLSAMVIPFSPGALLKGDRSENIELEPLDKVFVFSTWVFRDKPAVTINGEVRQPGLVTIDENLTVKDLVLLSGGLTPAASFKEYELYRRDQTTREVVLMRLDLGKALKGESRDNPVLQDGDLVVIHSASETAQMTTVMVHGQVNRPGEYPYAANMKVSDLLFAGGGTTMSAYLREAELASYETVDEKSVRVDYRSIDLEKALAGDSAHDIALRPHDILFVREMIDWGRQQYIELKGEVRFPGRYVFRKGERLSSVIKRAGGYTDQAYLRGAVFTRESVRELQQKSIEEAIGRLELRLLAEASGQAISSTTTEGPKQVEASMAVRRELLQKLKSAKAQGRIAIDLEQVDSTPQSRADVTLEDDDTLLIPARPTQVQIIGAVHNPTAFIHNGDVEVRDYISMAGGLKAEADKGRIFVLKSDGTALAKGPGFWGGVLSGGLLSASLDPGDTIVVPEELDKGLWVREVKDLTQILYQIAVTAGVLIVAF